MRQFDNYFGEPPFAITLTWEIHNLELYIFGSQKPCAHDTQLYPKHICHEILCLFF